MIILMSSLAGLFAGFIIGYFVYKFFFHKQAKVNINTTLMKSKYGPIFTAKGDVELVVSSDVIEIEKSGIPIDSLS